MPAAQAATYRTVGYFSRSVGGGYSRHWDDTAKAAWLFDGDTFWTFDDAQVMTEKAGFVKGRSLGGVGIWSMDGDDSQGSLMTAIANGLQ